jgi:hypothetical protein
MAEVCSNSAKPQWKLLQHCQKVVSLRPDRPILAARSCFEAKNRPANDSPIAIGPIQSRRRRPNSHWTHTVRSNSAKPRRKLLWHCEKTVSVRRQPFDARGSRPFRGKIRLASDSPIAIGPIHKIRPANDPQLPLDPYTHTQPLIRPQEGERRSGARDPPPE